MDVFEVGEEYRVREEKKHYIFSGTSNVYCCGVFVCEDGYNHIFELNNMQKVEPDFKYNGEA